MRRRVRLGSTAIGLLGLVFLPGCSRSDPDRALVGRIDALASNAIREGRDPGISIAVAREGKAILAKGYGQSDVENQVPAKANTVYRIASVTKQFTAAATMDLVDRGRLGLDDEVTKFLPDYPTEGNRLTVRHLLNQTSGIPDYFKDESFAASPRRKLPREELLKLIAGRFDTPPGQEWAYSNSNYFLLELIIEKASGQSYVGYLSERIFVPLQMRDTFVCPEEPTGPNQARGYKAEPDGRFSRVAPLVESALGDGALCSTVGDLVRWNQGFHGHRFVTPDSYKLMTTPTKLGDGRLQFYGFGLFLSSGPGLPTIWHAGGVPGFTSKLTYYSLQKVTLVVLQNNDPSTVKGLDAEVGKVLASSLTPLH